jgi:L,D-transpeptidase-like protein
LQAAENAAARRRNRHGFVIARSLRSGLLLKAVRTSSGTRSRRRGLALAVLVLAALTAAPVHAGGFDAGLLPRSDLLKQALAAYHRVESAGMLHTKLLTVIDYSLPSWERRLWVLDPAGLRVLFHEFVAHGRGSATEVDPDHAVRFGNEAASLRSSLGTFLTGDTYTGKHGHSLELVGLDPGVNDNALERRIVMHPADYVSAEFRAARGGRVGRSWGCPALDPAVAPALIDRIQDRSVIYVAGATDQRFAALPASGIARRDARAR